MPVKENQFKANNFKPENQPRQSSPKAGREKQPRQKPETRRDYGLMNSQIIKIAGLFSLLVSVYFLVAFTSYLFTWKDDQSYVKVSNGGWHNPGTKEVSE